MIVSLAPVVRPLLLVVLTAIVAHLNGIDGGFIWDDRNLVVGNTRTHGLSQIPALLGFGDASFGFRAVRDLSYALDYSLGGLNPRVYHLSNLVYHAICAALVTVLAHTLSGRVAVALWTGLLFAVHPVHVDAVTYISGRRDLLSTLFYLVSVLCYIRFRERDHRGWLMLAAVTGVLGVLAKEMAATFPAAWFLYDAWRQGPDGILHGAHRSLNQHWRIYLSTGVVAGLLIVYVIIAQNLTLGAGPYGDNWPTHARSEVVVLAYALRLLVLPIHLLIDYQHFILPVTDFRDPRLWAAVALLLAVIGGFSGLFRGRRTAAFSAHWLWLTYLPAMQVVPHSERFAEHYLYLPSVGFALLFGLGVTQLLDRARQPRTRRAVVAVATVLCLILALRTVVRNQDYANEITVFEAALAVHGRAPRVWTNLAMAYSEAGRTEDAVELLRRGMLITRDPMLTANLAHFLGRQGRWQEALMWLLDAYARYPREPNILHSLGDAFAAVGALDDAIRAYGELAQVDARRPQAALSLANLLRRQQRWHEAITQYRVAATLNPRSATAFNGMGMALSATGDFDAATDAYHRATDVDPADADGWNNLGTLAARTGNWKVAESHFQMALAAHNTPSATHINLVRVRVQLGDCSGADAALNAARNVVSPATLAQLNTTRARCTEVGAGIP